MQVIQLLFFKHVAIPISNVAERLFKQKQSLITAVIWHIIIIIIIIILTSAAGWGRRPRKPSLPGS